MESLVPYFRANYALELSNQDGLLDIYTQGAAALLAINLNYKSLAIIKQQEGQRKKTIRF